MINGQLPVDESQLIEFAKAVELAATKVLEGLHHSARGGQGIEYHSTVGYSDGEDAKYIDWKRYASSGRYFVNRFLREEKTSWTILLDSSESMKYGRKAERAAEIAGSLIFLANVWGDRWQLYPDIQNSLSLAFEHLATGRAGPLDFSRLSGLTPDATSRMIVISDFFWEDSVIQEQIPFLQSEFKQLSLLQVLDPRESNFDFSGVIEFEDPESPEKVILDSAAVKKLYQKTFESHERLLSAQLKDTSFLLPILTEDEKLEHQLLNLFEKL